MNLELIAQDLGVRITRGALPAGWWGSYNHRTLTITLHRSLGPVQYKSTLAHELGHAHHRHETSTPGNEWQASVWAARTLIQHDQFLEAAYAADRVAGVANILEVMPADVETYMHIMSNRDKRRLLQSLNNLKSA